MFGTHSVPGSMQYSSFLGPAPAKAASIILFFTIFALHLPAAVALHGLCYCMSAALMLIDACVSPACHNCHRIFQCRSCRKHTSCMCTLPVQQ